MSRKDGVGGGVQQPARRHAVCAWGWGSVGEDLRPDPEDQDPQRRCCPVAVADFGYSYQDSVWQLPKKKKKSDLLKQKKKSNILPQALLNLGFR